MLTSSATGESTFRAMLDAAPDAMVGVNSEGVIVMVNVQTEAVFGYTREDLLGKQIEILVPERVRDVHPTHRKEYFLEPGTRPMGADLELAGRRADGTEFPAEITLSAIETEEGQVALAAIRDITERLKAEDTFQAMLDAAPDAMVGVNRDGVIVMANAQTEAVFGYERDALLGEPIEVLVPDHVKGLHPGHRTADLREPRIRPMGAPLELGPARRRIGVPGRDQPQLDPDPAGSRRARRDQRQHGPQGSGGGDPTRQEGGGSREPGQERLPVARQP